MKTPWKLSASFYIKSKKTIIQYSFSKDLVPFGIPCLVDVWWVHWSCLGRIAYFSDLLPYEEKNNFNILNLDNIRMKYVCNFVGGKVVESA